MAENNKNRKLGPENFRGDNDLLSLKKAEIKSEHCNYVYRERTASGEVRVIDVKKSSTVNHLDLKMAFELFNGHLALVCEEVEVKDIVDVDIRKGRSQTITDKLATFMVVGVQFDGEIGDGSITLFGQKLLKTGEILSLVTPNIEWDSNYAFYNELHAACETLREEVTEYHYGKAAPNLQAELEFQEQNS